MPTLMTRDLGHSFGDQTLYEHLALAIEPRDHIGLVGPNGVGKSTLLQNLAGILPPAEGNVIRDKDLTLGYLRQEAVLTFAGKNNTIYEEMLAAFADLRRDEAALKEIERQLAAGDASAATLDSYGLAQELFENQGGYQYQVEIKRVLQGLGFGADDWERPLAELSGGQKTRALLARLLLESPDLLILDEPTNHLDGAAVEWLEQTLRRWNGALIIVSHDRYFLDRTVNRIWELTPGPPDSAAVLRTYKGNYSAYVSQRDEAHDRAQRLFDEEKARLEGEVAYIRKHIAGGKSDQAKGRLRLLSRDLHLVELLGMAGMAEYRRSGKRWIEMGESARSLAPSEAASRVAALRPPRDQHVSPTILLPESDRSGRAVVRTKEALIGYPDVPLFRIGDLRLGRGGRAALLGPNGSGKTTLLKSLIGEIRPLQGDFDLGQNVKIGYFAQAHDQLDVSRKVLDEVLSRSDMKTSEARRYLAQYLFVADDVFKLVGDLSGGERGRLALALLSLDGANLLLLDEPTNHLDIPSQEVLQSALEAYDGTVILVSHDRYLVDRLATELWVLEGDILMVYPGTYAEYRRDIEGADETEVAAASVSIEDSETADSWDAWFDEMADDSGEESRRGKGKRPSGSSAAALDALADAEDWLARVTEALEEVAAEGGPRLAELQTEKNLAEEELAACLAALED